MQPKIPESTLQKFARLKEVLTAPVREGLLVAFSGGVDSAFLLWAAEMVRRESGGRVLALTTVSASTPAREKADAQRFASTLGVPHIWTASEELSNPEYRRNDENRCYHCKSELFRISHEKLGELECRHIAYGYNASDRGDFRPGHRAALENEILSPLEQASLEKDDIRILMRANGLEFAEKPASPCLSSRLMRGVEVTENRLSVIEGLEEILRQRGAGVVRARLHRDEGGEWVRLEVGKEDMAHALEASPELADYGRQRGLRWVLLDLAGYQQGGGNASS